MGFPNDYIQSILQVSAILIGITLLLKGWKNFKIGEIEAAREGSGGRSAMKDRGRRQLIMGLILLAVGLYSMTYFLMRYTW